MKQHILYIVSLWWVSTMTFAQNDSLSHYLELAGANNPLLKSEFLTYKASLEKVPQAGAYADPQLEMGFFLKPMEVLDGKQIADFRLMQMFPWFGTRKAARNEATEMSRMAFEQFRMSRDNLFLEVKSQWYSLCNLNQRLHNIRDNMTLLTSLKDLATNRFASPSTRSGNSPSASATSPVSNSTPSGTSEMAGMGERPSAMPQLPQKTGGNMNAMQGDGGMGNSSSGMSSVLRIQLEINELEEEEQGVCSEITSATAKFNALMNRSSKTVVTVPDSIVPRVFPVDDETLMKTIRQQNPMLAMITAETAAYKAKLKMDQRMGLPMFGIGLQYSILAKRMGMGMPTTHMNGEDMIMPMVSLSIPIYRHKYTAQQNESRLLGQAAEEKYTNTLNTLTSGYIEVRQQLEDAARKVRLYEQQSQLALVTYQLAVKEFASGNGNLSNALEVRRQLLDYQFKRSQSIATYNTVTAMLENLLSESETE